MDTGVVRRPIKGRLWSPLLVTGKLQGSSLSVPPGAQALASGCLCSARCLPLPSSVTSLSLFPHLKGKDDGTGPHLTGSLSGFQGEDPYTGPSTMPGSQGHGRHRLWPSAHQNNINIRIREKHHLEKLRFIPGNRFEDTQGPCPACPYDLL